MRRISTYMPNNDMQYHLRRREWEMSELQNKMADQTRIKELRDDPIAASHSVRYHSKITRLNRFSKNVESIQSDHRIAEGYIRSAEEVLLRLRDIAVQGANGVYSGEESRYMGQEVNQLLNELVEIANAKNGDGTAVFSGDKSLGQSFRVETGTLPGMAEKGVTAVRYLGTVNAKMTEISDESFMNNSFPGNRVFWAESQQIMARVNAESYQVPDDTAVLIDGETIPLKAGDNIGAIIAKINRSDAAVKASLDPVSNGVVLQSTAPHQLWIEDQAGGAVLEDLGLVKGGQRPPDNIHRDAVVSGGSLFDMVINLRDSLYAGDLKSIGGKSLAGIDQAHHNMLSELAKIGAEDERLQTVYKRLQYEIPEIEARNSKETDLDMAEAITDLKMLESNHRAALQTAGRILKPTLLDFLR